MDVQLYVYDLSRGLARQFSGGLLGFQIDAVYHTSIVLSGIEYYFGQGIQTSYAGRTHHGQPMEIIPMGKTELPVEVILEYMESLKETYTAESYDLFLHNCNNFTNDLAQFLVGRGIPDKIVNLPQSVLNTPFGQMIKGQIDQAMRPIVQAPSAGPPPSLMPSSTSSATSKPATDTKVPPFASSSQLAPSPFAAIPPLPKVQGQLLASLQGHAAVKSLVEFLKSRAAKPNYPQESSTPDVRQYIQVLHEAIAEWQGTTDPTQEAKADAINNDQLFALLDILRAALADTRCVGQFVEPTPNGQQGQTGTVLVLSRLLTSTYPGGDKSIHSLHVTILRLFVNLLSSHVPISIRLRLLRDLADQNALSKMVQLAVDALTHSSQAANQGSPEEVKKAAGKEKMAVTAAAKLSWAIAGIYHNGVKGREAVTHDSRVELLAATVEALKTTEESRGKADTAELREAIVRALGLLCYVDEAEGVWDYRDLCDAFDVKGLLQNTGLEGQVKKVLG